MNQLGAGLMSRRSRTCAVPLALLAACWTGEPPKAPAPSQTVQRTQLDVPYVIAPDATSAPQALTAQALGNQLHATGPADLPTFVSGPVVMLDLDTGIFTTLCGGAAQVAAHDWGLKLANPSRISPMCVDSTGRTYASVTPNVPLIVCVQSTPDLLVVMIENSAGPRLAGAVIDTTARMNSQVKQLLAQVAAAVCP